MREGGREEGGRVGRKLEVDREVEVEVYIVSVGLRYEERLTLSDE